MPQHPPYGLRQRYDVVLINPPFGEPSNPSNAYLEKAYPRTKNERCSILVVMPRKPRTLNPHPLMLEQQALLDPPLKGGPMAEPTIFFRLLSHEHKAAALAA